MSAPATDRFQSNFTAAMRSSIGWWVAVIGALATSFIWVSTNVATVSQLETVRAECAARDNAQNERNAIAFAGKTDVAERLARLEKQAELQTKALNDILATLRGYDWGQSR